VQRAAGLRIEVAVWAAMMAATLVSWWLGDGHGAMRMATTIVFAVGFGKVYLVGRYFMELRSAPFGLRFVFAAWCVAVFMTISALYLFM
jgi:hypothetical protein